MNKVISVNLDGNRIATISVPDNATQDEVLKLVRANMKVAMMLKGKNIIHTAYFPNKMVSFSSDKGANKSRGCCGK